MPAKVVIGAVGVVVRGPAKFGAGGPMLKFTGLTPLFQQRIRTVSKLLTPQLATLLEVRTVGQYLDQRFKSLVQQVPIL